MSVSVESGGRVDVLRDEYRAFVSIVLGKVSCASYSEDLVKRGTHAG